MKDSAYKLAYLDKTKMLSAARKALIAADAQYYAWSPREQERFRVSMGDEPRRKIQCVLLDDLLDIKCSTEAVDDIWDDIPISDINPLNWASLLTTGIGDDYIYLNEYMAKDKTLLDFPTLYDYDYADYLFQEQARKQDFPDYKGADYYAWRHPSWVRLLIKEQFHYATFTSLATHVLDGIEAAGNETIGQLIPHKYVDGKNHGKPEKGGFLWDVQVDAAGQEAQLDELKSRWYAYQQERWTALSAANKDLPATVYAQDGELDDDPQKSFIFANEATLKQIRWRHFLLDCEPLMAEYAAVETLLAEEIDRANVCLAENHQDIQKNFDPAVVKLRKKRKIIMSEGALDDLSSIEEEL